jgi:hypothetical protein
MKKLLFLALLFTTCSAAFAADPFSTLEERMSGKEFKETGLVKLTDEELAVLNDWLRSHSIATLSNASAAQTVIRLDGSGAIPLTTNDKRGLGYLGQHYNDDPDNNVIYGTVVGTISGWAKGDLFKLSNGMIWEQTEKETSSIQPLGNPDVTITKNFMGNWQLTIVGQKDEIRVQRIQ